MPNGPGEKIKPKTGNDWNHCTSLESIENSLENKGNIRKSTEIQGSTRTRNGDIRLSKETTRNT